MGRARAADAVYMQLDPTVEEQERLAETLELEGTRMGAAERRAAAALTLLFLAGTAALWALYPPHVVHPLAAVLSLLVFAAATRVPFDTPFGYTAPTQLAFVPLVFAMPIALAPCGVVVALMLAMLPDVAQRRVDPSRLASAPGNACFALGPAFVFAVADTRPEAAGAALLLTALLAEFAIDFLASSLRNAIARGASFSSQLAESWVYGVDAALSGVGYLVAREVPAHPAYVLLILPLLALFAMFSHERRQRLESLLELNNAYRGTALVLGDVVEADDGYTGEHSKGVVALALEVGEQLGLDAERRRNLEFAALLHDVGKIAVPKEIINKPGSLSPEEWTVIKTHTIEGERMLSRVGGFMREVGLIVRSHHERWDGGGYPDGLAGEEIPLEARIITCCDSWNAMRTDRSYRRALSHEVALAELRAGSGSQFDPRVVDALLAVVQPQADAAAEPVAPASAQARGLTEPAFLGR
jgi:putative nucleotidyltransferase with HDIG domain